MRAVKKSLDEVPESLTIPTNSKSKGTTTHNKRNEIIADGKYTSTSIYDNRYKIPDIKHSLQLIYHGKCAFCEQNARPPHVEHYRPKSIYFWLAYSWDNLLFACATCNIHKSDKFDIITRDRSEFTGSYESIHKCCKSYSLYEDPLLLNPEIDNLDNIFTFNIKGQINSKSIKGIYTIKTCLLDRDTLNTDRFKLIKDLENDLTSEIADNPSKDDQKIAIKTILNIFKKRAFDEKQEFTAFRKYILKHELKTIITSLVT